MLGHSDIKTTERYGEYSTEALEDIIEGEIVHRKLIPNKMIQPLELMKKIAVVAKYQTVPVFLKDNLKAKVYERFSPCAGRGRKNRKQF